MQIKIAFKAIFLVDGGFLAGGTAKCTPKCQERFGDSAEQDSQEEGERRKLAGKSASTKQLMAMANINKQHFLLAGSCAVVLSVVFRSSLGKIGEGKEKIKRREILILGIV